MKKLIITIILLGIGILVFVFLPIYQGTICELIPENICYKIQMNLIDYVIYKIEHQKNLSEVRLLNAGNLLPLEFPKSIGNYHFVASERRISKECEMFIGDNGRQRICLQNTRIIYQKGITDEVVILQFFRVLEGKFVTGNDRYRYFMPENLEGYDTGWVGGIQNKQTRRFTWFPQKDVDIITVNEGTLKYYPDADSVSSQYEDYTTGTSLVSAYFLDKYPPESVPVNNKSD